jgi:glycosyltransferase involved in cell wall biosynthesis
VSLTEKSLSIILPAKNEAASLEKLLPTLKQLHPSAEIIVVNDGSTDNTLQVCQNVGVSVITHPYSMGNGAAIKSGARAANGDILVFMDADGQHNPADIPALLDRLNQGYDMAVGARSAESQASIGRLFANTIYNKLASWMVNQRVDDLTSGFRAVVGNKFIEFMHLLPNGFSYPTTITMSFFRAGYPVAYVPITANKREGTSHISIFRDGVRFLLIIFKVGSLYSPLKLFLPFSLFHGIIGTAYCLYTIIAYGRFTNMSALLLTTAVIIFLIGLVSEQITMLIYQTREHK